MEINEWTALEDVLLEKPLKDLIRLIRDNSLDYPWDITEEDQKLLWKMLNDEEHLSDFQHFYRYVPNVWKGETSREKKENAERIKQENEENWHKASLLKVAEGYRYEMSRVIASYLLRPEAMQEVLLNMNGEAYGFLQEMAASKKKPVDDYMPVDFTGKKRMRIGSLANNGYAALQNSLPQENEDLREHMTGIFIPAEVLQVFRKINTKGFQISWHTSDKLFASMLALMRYYEAAPVKAVHELYNQGAAADPLCRKMNDQEFLDAVRHACDDDLFALGEAENEFYVVEQSMVEDLDDFEETMEEYIDGQYHIGEKHYMPSWKEAQEFAENGYWPSREPYANLKEFLQQYYQDEQFSANRYAEYMSGMNPDGNYEIYSNDKLDNDTDQEINYIATCFLFDNTPDDVYSQCEDIVVKLNEKAKKEFRDILEACRRITPSPYRNGYTPEQVEKQE